MAYGKAKSILFMLAGIGFLIGGLLGFLFRPSAFLIGQLPFSMVITRGVNLQGVDRILIPLAKSSFNNMLLIAGVGALIGAIVCFLMSKK
jgi:hypothetical protein